MKARVDNYLYQVVRRTNGHVKKIQAYGIAQDKVFRTFVTTVVGSYTAYSSQPKAGRKTLLPNQFLPAKGNIGRPVQGTMHTWSKELQWELDKLTTSKLMKTVAPFLHGTKKQQEALVKAVRDIYPEEYK